MPDRLRVRVRACVCMPFATAIALGVSLTALAVLLALGLAQIALELGWRRVGVLFVDDEWGRSGPPPQIFPVILKYSQGFSHVSKCRTPCPMSNNVCSTRRSSHTAPRLLSDAQSWDSVWDSTKLTLSLLSLACSGLGGTYCVPVCVYASVCVCVQGHGAGFSQLSRWARHGPAPHVHAAKSNANSCFPGTNCTGKVFDSELLVPQVVGANEFYYFNDVPSMRSAVKYQAPYRPTRRYVVSGTDAAYAPTGASRLRGTRLRACCGMRGTEGAYCLSDTESVSSYEGARMSYAVLCDVLYQGRVWSDRS